MRDQSHGRSALSGAYDGSVVLWDLSSGKQIKTLNGHADWVISLAFAPDGKKALTGSKDGLLIYWDLERGEPVLQLTSAPNDNWALGDLPLWTDGAVRRGPGWSDLLGFGTRARDPTS